MRLLFIVLLLTIGIGVTGGIAGLLGRDSAIWHAVSRVTTRVLPTPNPGPPLTLPFQTDFDAPPEGWRWFQRDLAAPAWEADGLVVESPVESVWYQNVRGPMYWTAVEGNVDVRLDVRTRRRSAPDLPLDRAWQFAGLILRDPTGDVLFGTENYVFNVVGFRGQRLEVETKSTQGGRSDVQGFPWPSGDAELRVVRQGDRFTLFARTPGAEAWTTLQSYERPDLRNRLQLGVITYAFDYDDIVHDLRATFRSLSVSSPSS